MQRYGVVLQELRLEVLRNNSYLGSVSTPQAGGIHVADEINQGETTLPQSPQVNQTTMSHQYASVNFGIDENNSRIGGNRVFDAHAEEGGPAEGLPASLETSIDEVNNGFMPMSSWAQFDSLVLTH